MPVKKLTSRIIIPLTLSAIGIISTSCLGKTNSTPYHSDSQRQNLTISSSIGSLSTTSHEYVYLSQDATNKLSQLDWKIKNATILKTDFSYHAPTLYDTSYNLNFWVTTTEKKGSMDDFDWLTPNQKKWSHHSQHKNTKLNEALSIDFSINQQMYNRNNLSLKPAIGYSVYAYNFSAYGGQLDYKGVTATIPSHINVINYEQIFYTPYLGLLGNYKFNKFNFDLDFKYSPFARAQDTDDHILRLTTFDAKANQASFFLGRFKAAYQMTKNFKFFADSTYSKFYDARGDMRIIDHLNYAKSNTVKKIAGLDNTSLAITTGFEYGY